MEKSYKTRIYILLSVLCVVFSVIGCASIGLPEHNSETYPGLYTITFDTGTDEIIIPTARYAEGEVVVAPKKPSRKGFKFLGWKLDGETYEFGEMPGRDITVVADWQELIGVPEMYIDLFGGDGNMFPLSNVTREQYVDSVITLTNTEEQYELDSVKAYFKGRGNHSWTAFSKKGYKIKFDKKQSVLGREKNKHWVLIACVQFDETTMSRNYLAYNMAGEIFDGIEYTTPAYWIDVYVNGQYCGVYLLCEQVRVDKGRVDIESEYGADDTGYLIEYDALATGEEGVDYFRVDGVKYPFTVHSPDPEDGKYETEGEITKERFKQQIAFIKDYVSRVYHAALSGDYATFAELVDADSFVDMFILHELFKNVDTGWSSFYLYKKPGGKLFAGPTWDFDGTANGAPGRGDRTPEGLFVPIEGANGDVTTSMLYVELYKTDGFQTALRARWKVLSPKIGSFLDERLNDGVYEKYKQVMGRNYVLWNGKSQAAAEKDWVADVKALKRWLQDRIAWLNGEWTLQ